MLWVGSLWSLALWVAPTLFFAQPDRHLAGLLAARLFAVETYFGMAVAALGFAVPGRGRPWAVYVAVALLAINEWVLKRLMEAGACTGRRPRSFFRRLARGVCGRLSDRLPARSLDDLEAAALKLSAAGACLARRIRQVRGALGNGPPLARGALRRASSGSRQMSLHPAHQRSR